MKVKFDGKSSLLLIWYVIELAVSTQFHEKEITENTENKLPKTLLNISREYIILYLFLTCRSDSNSYHSVLVSTVRLNSVTVHLEGLFALCIRKTVSLNKN